MDSDEGSIELAIDGLEAEELNLVNVARNPVGWKRNEKEKENKNINYFMHTVGK